MIICLILLGNKSKLQLPVSILTVDTIGTHYQIETRMIEFKKKSHVENGLEDTRGEGEAGTK